MLKIGNSTRFELLIRFSAYNVYVLNKENASVTHHKSGIWQRRLRLFTSIDFAILWVWWFISTQSNVRTRIYAFRFQVAGQAYPNRTLVRCWNSGQAKRSWQPTNVDDMWQFLDLHEMAIRSNTCHSDIVDCDTPVSPDGVVHQILTMSICTPFYL